MCIRDRDTRAKEICDEIKTKVDEDELFALSGNPLEPSYTLPKILWYKKHKPEIYSKIYKLSLIHISEPTRPY